MAFDIIKTAETIFALDHFLEKRRPPVEIRNKVDLAYRIENQSIELFEIRPHWQKPDEKIENPIAKTTWVETQKCWKIYWMRADLKWHLYQPVAKVKTIEEFLKVVDADAHGCFWG